MSRIFSSGAPLCALGVPVDKGTTAISSLPPAITEKITAGRLDPGRDPRTWELNGLYSNIRSCCK